jgi:hypothetical protein
LQVKATPTAFTFAVMAAVKGIPDASPRLKERGAVRRLTKI